MDAAVLTAMIVSATSLAVALLSAFFANKASRTAQEEQRKSESLARLHGATGGMRLELFLGARSFARRLVHYYDPARPGHPYPLATRRNGNSESAYHGGGLVIYRLLRPLTVGEIIEKQTFDVDLLLDPIMVDLLRFSHTAVEMLTGEQLGSGFGDDGGMPGFDMGRCWDPVPDRRRPGSVQPRELPAAEIQRVRASYLRSAASALVIADFNPATGREANRCMTHPEFCQRWEHPEGEGKFHRTLEPVKVVIDGFSPTANPIFWLRLVGYGHACKWFYDRVRAMAAEGRTSTGQRAVLPWARRAIDYQPLTLPVAAMLRAAKDPYLTAYAHEFERRFDEVIAQAL
jgi:hypothetical protein